MLIKINATELDKFPKPICKRSAIQSELPADELFDVLTPSPFWYKVYAEDFGTYDCVIFVEGDIDLFKASSIKHTEVTDIPLQFKQLRHEGKFGAVMSKATIEEIDIIKTKVTKEDAAEATTLEALRDKYTLVLQKEATPIDISK